MSDELTVPLGLLRRYLMFHGWRQSEHAPTATLTFEGHSYANTFFRERSSGQRNVDLYLLSEPGLEDVELVVPRTLGTSEAIRRLEGVIQTLSQVEGRDRTQIISEVRSIGFDLVKSRIPDELVYDDTIHLDRAVSYTANVKRLLAASATTELTPDPYFLRLRKEATQYADQCRFGHTFKGSFGFTIESPVTPRTQVVFAGMEQTPPFERRVVQRLARGISVVQEAVKTEDVSIVVGGFPTGFNANMCEEFATLIEHTAPSGMAFAFTFSPEWPAPALGEFLVGPQHLELSRAAAKMMREQPTSTVVEVSGRIIRLQNEADPTDLLDETHDREVVVHWESEELGKLNVKMLLAPNEYLAAAEAHLHGRQIRVKGRLERQGRRWVLVDPTNFSS